MNRSRSRSRSRRPRRLPALPAVAVALVAGLALVAVAATRGPGSAVAVPQTAPVTVTGAALPPPRAGAGDPALGAPAPALAGTSFDGTPVEVRPGRGRGALLVFVAHWCPHCRREVPRLVERLRDAPLPGGVDLYAVSTAVDPRRPNHPPSEWLRDEGWPAPVLRDDAAGTASDAYGLGGFPYFVAVDPHGRVAARVGGEVDDAGFAALVAAAGG